MFSIEKTADDIALRLAASLQMDGEKKAVMAYGIFCFLQVFFSILLVIIFGLLFHVLAEAMIISFAIIILRKYSGGAHASTPGKCLIIGTVVCVLPAILIHYTVINYNILLFSGLMIFAVAFYIVYAKAPVDSVKKPINKSEKRRLYKRGSLVIVGVYLIISFLCMYVYYFGEGSSRLIQFSASVIFGTAWQTFTLTSAGDRMLKLIDSHLIIRKSN